MLTQYQVQIKVRKNRFRFLYLSAKAKFRTFTFSTPTTAGHVTSTTCVSGKNKSTDMSKTQSM